MRDITKVSDVEAGLKVIIEGKNGPKEGVIRKVLSSMDNEKGIKVQLDTGDKGRIIELLGQVPLNKIDNEKKKSINFSEKIDKPIVIDIEDNFSSDLKSSIISDNQVKFEVVTKFFHPIYCRALKGDIAGIVIFKVNAIDVNLAIYKINLYLTKFCISKDLKYEVVKINK